MTTILILLEARAVAAHAPPRDLFPLTQGRFGTLGAPAKKQEWDLLGAYWFKSGDCYWQAPWVPDSGVQATSRLTPRPTKPTQLAPLTSSQ